MPNFVKPIVASDDLKQYRIAADGSLLDVALIPVSQTGVNLLSADNGGLRVDASSMVSATAGNLLAVGLDGKLVVQTPPVDDVLSTVTGNYIRYGTDRGLYLDGNDILSNGAPNLLSISPVDGKIILAEDSVKQKVSVDAGNVLRAGSDGGAYLGVRDIISADVNNAVKPGSDNLLYVRVLSTDAANKLTEGSDGAVYLSGASLLTTATPNVLTVASDGGLQVTPQSVVNANDDVLSATDTGIISTLSLAYDTLVGKLDIVGREGRVVGTVTIPSSVSMLEDVHIVINPSGQPEGTYFMFTFRLADGTTRTEYLSASVFSGDFEAGQGIVVSPSNAISVNLDLVSPLTFMADGRLSMDMTRLRSAQSGNALVIGSDGRLFVDAASYTSGNGITVGTDDTISVYTVPNSGLVFDAAGRLGINVSTAATNLLSVTAQGELFVDSANIPSGDMRVSTDRGNITVLGTDGNIFTPADYGTMGY